MKIAIAVHGRFHAFDLARALLRRGNDVTLFTNYPRWAVKRFDFPPGRVRSLWLHGVMTRTLDTLCRRAGLPYPDAWTHPSFGCWVAQQIEKEQWDVVHCWSGVAEEAIHARNGANTLKMIMRGSAHIREQAHLLAEEQQRIGVPMEQPGPWIIAREEREYELADRIVVLSSFARDSFIAQGVSGDKLILFPLGVSTDAFRPAMPIVEARCRRIISGAPLRVLYVGALSFQKGMWDLAAVLRKVDRSRFQFRLVGPQTSEIESILADLHQIAEIIPKQPQQQLPKWYEWGDLFIFPTIQDGFAVVLTQAQASGLPILTTTNCSGPDIVQQGKTGWILPIRSPEAFVDQLSWCDTHRKALAAIVRYTYDDFLPRDWADVAADFEAICRKWLMSKDTSNAKLQ